MPAASFTKSRNTEIAKDSASLMGLCRNMESAARSVSAWNSIELIRASRTTFTHFPGLVPRRGWPIPLRGLCKSDLLGNRKKPCEGQCNTPEIPIDRNRRRKNFAPRYRLATQIHSSLNAPHHTITLLAAYWSASGSNLKWPRTLLPPWIGKRYSVYQGSHFFSSRCSCRCSAQG